MFETLANALGFTLHGAIQPTNCITTFNVCMFVTLTLCYGYQFFYVLVVLLSKKEIMPEAARMHRFAVLIAARNESATIGNLLDSLGKQKYPQELIEVFVIADNCTDNTAAIARSYGAVVFERHDTNSLGKGYALDYGYQRIQENEAYCDAFDAYLVFDADNLLDPNFISAMNRTLDQGADISTSFRNSKNYADNWISAGYGLWFLREARFLSQARKNLHTTCAISGTGFYVSARLLDSIGGWKWHLLTEDIEFSIYAAIKQKRIAYTPDAILYDEQPTTFVASWVQRERWAKGFYQVFKYYGLDLLRCIANTSHGEQFGCFDMLVTIAPGLLLTLSIDVFNVMAVIVNAYGAGASELLLRSLFTIAICLANYTLVMFFLGVVTTLAEWNSIHAKPYQKVLYLFTFPVFMLTYIPIAVTALFKKPQWKPIEHSVTLSIEELTRTCDSASVSQHGPTYL